MISSLVSVVARAVLGVWMRLPCASSGSAAGLSCKSGDCRLSHWKRTLPPSDIGSPSKHPLEDLSPHTRGRRQTPSRAKFRNTLLPLRWLSHSLFSEWFLPRPFLPCSAPKIIRVNNTVMRELLPVRCGHLTFAHVLRHERFTPKTSPCQLKRWLDVHLWPIADTPTFRLRVRYRG